MRSIERAQELGEVFTNKREVDAMLDLVPEMFVSLDSTFLEPACGHGNFLVEILARKIELITAERFGLEPGWFEFSLLRAIASIYAIDISEENVLEARHRMFEIVKAAHMLHGDAASPEFDDAVLAILESNVLMGDSLTQASDIQFINYVPIDGHKFERIPFFLEEPEMDLFYQPPMPLETVHYLDLGKK